MMQPQKFRGAIEALNRVLVVGRALAYEKADHGVIAQVLDVAEYLALMFVSEEDRSDEFRSNLVGLAELDPRFNIALEAFGRGETPVP